MFGIHVFFKKHRRGESIISYALLLGLVSVIGLLSISLMGTSIRDVLNRIVFGIEDSGAVAAGSISGSGGNAAPVWVTASLDSVLEGDFVSVQLEATDAEGDSLSYSVTSGVLPGGLSLSTSGLIEGVALIDGTFAFDVTVSDGTNNISQSLPMIVGNRALAYIDNDDLPGDDCFTELTACRPETLELSPIFAAELGILQVSNITLTSTFDMLEAQSLTSLGGTRVMTGGSGFNSLIIQAGTSISNLDFVMTDGGSSRKAIFQDLPSTPNDYGLPTLRVNKVNITTLGRNTGIEIDRLGITGDLDFYFNDLHHTGGETGIDITVRQNSTSSHNNLVFNVTNSSFKDFDVTSISPDAIIFLARGGYNTSSTITNNVIFGSVDPINTQVLGVSFSVRTRSSSVAPFPSVDLLMRDNNITGTDRAVDFDHENGGRSHIQMSDNVMIGASVLNVLEVRSTALDLILTGNAFKTPSGVVYIGARTNDDITTDGTARISVVGNTFENSGTQLNHGLRISTVQNVPNMINIVGNQFIETYQTIELTNDLICASIFGNDMKGTGSRHSFRIYLWEDSVTGNVNIRQGLEITATVPTIHRGISGNSTSSFPSPGIVLVIENGNDLDFNELPSDVVFESTCIIDPPNAPQL